MDPHQFSVKNLLICGLTLLASHCLGSATAWFGPQPTGLAYPTGEEDRQYAMLAYDLQHRAVFQRVASQTLCPEALIWDTDHDPLDVLLIRTEALLLSLERLTTRRICPLSPPNSRPGGWRRTKLESPIIHEIRRLGRREARLSHEAQGGSSHSAEPAMKPLAA